MANLVSSQPIERTTEQLFADFCRERRYGCGVSPRTEVWYRESWTAFREVLEGTPASAITKDTFTPAIERMIQRGVSPITINTYARAINAWLRWAAEAGHVPAVVRIPRLREPSLVVTTYRPEEITRLASYRARNATERRVQMLALLVADIGCRLNEALSLRTTDVDFENMLTTIREAKGGKQRVVPFSVALRKLLYRYVSAVVRQAGGLIFATRDGAALLQNNIRRDLTKLCKRIGIGVSVKGGFHAFRHSFATAYVAGGGDPLRLQKQLGHSTLEMTRRYTHLSTADLSAVHDRLSLLSVASSAR